MVIGRYRRCCSPALVVLALASHVCAEPPSAANNPPIELDRAAAFERARIYYESGNYTACIQVFTRLIGPEPVEDTRELKQRSSARTYLAACLIATGRVDQAREQFRQAILEDRQMEPPDPVVFPQAVIDLFLQVHGSLMDTLRRQQEEELRRSREEAQARALQEEQERRRVAELERLAATERVVHKNERWLAWVPFGVGQFQNRSPALGWLFLTSELALVATAVTATSIELGLHSQAEGGQAGLDERDLNAKLTAARTVGTAAWGAWIAVAAIGIIEANLSFRPEIPVAERTRPLPERLKSPTTPAPRVSPSVEPTAGGAVFGASGTF